MKAAVTTLALLSCGQEARSEPIYSYNPSRELSTIAGLSLGLGAAMVLEANTLVTPESNTAWDPETVKLFLDRPATRQWSPAASTASDLGFLGMTALPVAVIFGAPSGDSAWSLGSMYAEVLLGAATTNVLVKSLASRARPYVYNSSPEVTDRSQRDAFRSFYSGHSSSVFASAVFFGKVFSDLNSDSRWKPLAWAGPLALASGVGYLRFRAGMHFPTDIITGALVGSAFGYLVPELHRKEIGMSVAVNGRDRRSAALRETMLRWDFNLTGLLESR